MENVTLRFWHGGLFKKNLNELRLGGQERNFDVDLDELC